MLKSSEPPSDPARSASVLLVVPKGPARRAAARALRAAGYRLAAAREPYEGTVRFVERPADLVVLSLARFRPRDTAFVRAVKSRAPLCPILLLVPEGRRSLALAALKAGADAWLPEPFYAPEITALVAGLLRSGAPLPDPDASRAVGRLATEVAHAINNPLQILSLLGEAEDLPDGVRDGLQEEVRRIQGVVRILGRFALLGAPQRRPEHLGRALRASLEAAEAAGAVTATREPPDDGPSLPIDPEQARAAFDSMLGFLAARSPRSPLPVASQLRAVPPGAPRAVEASVRGEGVRIAEDALDRLTATVMLTRDETREVYPGLALPDAVARGHGGRLIARQNHDGTVLALRLPVPSAPP